MTDSDLRYEHAAIEAMAGQLKAFVGRIDARLTNDVDRAFKNLLAGGWSGMAADSFQSASAAWHGKTVEMGSMLTMLQNAVNTASVDMNAKDKSLMGLFPG
jgi:WXG100 family type VII secretion target